MNRDEVHHLRDRLLLLAECSNPYKPQNVKRKARSTTIPPKLRSKSGPKWSMQDFVRRDPGYTPDIEHLVFPGRKVHTQQSVPNPPSKTRSRLAEMFALSRHLQNRSTDSDAKARSSTINRSVDSVLGPARASSASLSSTRNADSLASTRRWVAVEEPVRQTSSSLRISPAAEPDMAATRGQNVSVLHLRNTSEPWETGPASVFSSGNNIRSHSSGRSNISGGAPALTKHQSLGQGYKWDSTSGGFYPDSSIKSGDFYISGNCSRDISPVRWCDREVDGVYLGRSGWVQVQQRSLDENRKGYGGGISGSLELSRRTGIKLANYHFNSEPANKRSDSIKSIEPQRPAYLPLNTREHELPKSKTPSPPIPVCESSPPSITPIISPPPAFQDRKANNTNKPRSFFGKPPFLPRSNAIVDSDIISPPPSPTNEKHKNLTFPYPSQSRKIKLTPSPVSRPPILYPRIPQAKSLEDATNNRRTQFLQRHAESSSSSSSSMGFRSLDSCVNRPAMPRLSENTDSSIDVYEDADEEDNNSSSLNVSVVSTKPLPPPPVESARQREKISPSGRTRLAHHRSQTRRSPAGSDTNKPGNCSSRSSSSSSTDEFPSRSPLGSQQQLRRVTPNRPPQFSCKFPQDDSQKVRRSRSLQLPEKKPAGTYRDQSMQSRVSPQQPESHRVVVKMGTTAERPKRLVQPIKVQSAEGNILNEDILREAEIVTEFLYGTRSRAAAQALLMHRHNNNNREEKIKEPPKNNTNNGFDVFYVGGAAARDRQKLLQRGITTPNSSSKPQFKSSPTSETPNPCNSNTCDFWPHCAHRDSINNSRTQSMMRVSQSYPTHQRSLDCGNVDKNRGTLTMMDQNRKRSPTSKGSADPVHVQRRRNDSLVTGDYKPRERHLSPNKASDLHMERKISPVNSKSASRSPSAIGNSSNSSSSSDVWLTTSDRTISKSPKNAKSSGTSTPLEETSAHKNELQRETILTRPGSAPMEDKNAAFLESQQRSMSLPKSFLSANYVPSGSHSSRKQGSESLGSSPGSHRRPPTPETSHTAPVTPSHEANRRRSPLGTTERRAKATSTPQLLDPLESNNRRWSNKNNEGNPRVNQAGTKNLPTQRSLGSSTTESVLQKFRKTFSLRFQKKGSKDSCTFDSIEPFNETLCDPSEDDSPQRVPSLNSANNVDVKEESSEQKYKFGPLIWRSSKERKKTNKAIRSTKCNSGDSGIQIEMVSSCGGAGGDSSESHDTDPPGDELDSPPSVRRRATPSGKTSRPHSDLLNQILIDKFKAELQTRAHRHRHVRRTHSDLGGQRLFQWDPRSSYRRLMSSPAPIRGRPHRMSPRKKPPDAPDGVQLRGPHRRGQLRRSLSQPVDIDKLSPLMRTKAGGIRFQGGNNVSEDEQDGRLGTSEDEMMSDSESSVVSTNERKKSLELAMDEDVIILAEAVFDHVAIEAEELAFRAGDVIEVLETVNRDWWWGSAGGKEGWFPAAFVRLRVSQEDTVEDCLAAMASGHSVPSQLRRRTSISLLSNDQVRTSVVRELVHTEREFVKVLQDVAEGYIAECRKRKDMFTKEQIDTIFINLENILRFQSTFLKDLESCINWESPNKSCVGSCFIRHIEGFEMYSDYCNSHPVATALLQELYQFNNYSKFFEACRLMRGLIEIPLDGYLLTPIQRICKYPLQLAELLKYTKVDHVDYVNIKEALQAMRGVAVLINERKRRMESLEKLAAWQQRVETWEGEDLIEVSSQLIHQGEAVRVTSGMWTSNVMLFLFDHQVVYCKKDILKRNTYVYKGRIDLDTSEVIDIPDGKDVQTGVSVRHAIRIYSCIRDKWLLFCLRSSTEKQKWLQAFSEERKLVVQDKSNGMEFPSSAKQLARVAARSQRRPPRKPRGSKNYKVDSAYMGSMLQLNSHNTQNSNSLGRKVGTWFTFGVNRKTRHQHRDVS